jgi:SAM-dependent methyltransferase
MAADSESTSKSANLEGEEARIEAAYKRRGMFADPRYSYFNPSHVFLTSEVERRMLSLLGRHGRQALGQEKILEIGCGTGRWLREFIKWGARPENLVGIDLLPNLIAEARQLCPEPVTLRCESATEISDLDATFDVVLQATVFTSVLDFGMQRQIALEMLRVLKPDGLIVWFDFTVNNPRNPDVRGVNRKQILQLFPHCRVELERITLAPPIARSLAPYSWLACYLLSQLPFLCTHYLGAIRNSGVTQPSGQAPSPHRTGPRE